MLSSIPGYIFIAAAFSCSVWIILHLIGIWTVAKGPRLKDTGLDRNHPPLPALSVIFAARDEEESIRASLKAHLNSDYPDLEVVAVNDRSLDSTGRIIDEMAARDSRIKAVHIDTLPKGWLGKVHALDKGLEKASRGKWVIFTDADVRLEHDTLSRAVSMTQKRGLDHLVLFPKLIKGTFMLDMAFIAFSILFLAGTRAFTIGRPGSRAFIGVGAFNMVRREVLDRTEGFEWLRMEIGDDVGLGLLLKNAGARTGFAFAGMGVHLQWYKDLPAMFNGMSKNLFSVARYSYARLALMLTVLAIFALSPLAILIPTSPLWLKCLSVSALLVQLPLGLVSRGLFIGRVTPYLFGPLGFMLVTMMIANSALRCTLKGGIEWRGTLYPIDEIRKGQRVKL